MVQNRMKTGPKYLQDRESFSLSFTWQRLWMVFLILALPFIAVSWKYLEALERTGPAGAAVAGMTMSAIIAGYPALIWVLKKRRL